MTTVHVQSASARRAALRRSRQLNRLTIGWNVAEGVIAITAGALAGSVSLIGFGLDSGIEVSAAVILAWRLAKENQPGCMADFDRRATRLIACRSPSSPATWASGASVTSLAAKNPRPASSASSSLQSR